MITFAIPTWNRARHLRIAVQSIAAQINATAAPAQILISDNASDDGTPEVIAALAREFACVRTYRREQWGDYPDSFRTAFGLVESEWCWMFGDDDVLLPGALDRMLGLLRDGDAAFYHVSEAWRATRGNGANRLFTGSLFALCNRFGWLDMTGFMSCNVIRTDLLRECLASPSWELYRANAYAHACTILEVAAGKKAALVDVAMIGLQGERQDSAETSRYAKAGLLLAAQAGKVPAARSMEELAHQMRVDVFVTRYHLVVDAIAHLVQRRVIPAKLRATFFRYVSYFLWDRFINDLVAESTRAGRLAPDEAWLRVCRLAGFLADADDARTVLQAVAEARVLTQAWLDARGTAAAMTATRRLQERIDAHNAPAMDSCYASANLVTLRAKPREELAAA